MHHVILERLRQKHRTIAFPHGPAVLPDRFRGRPELHPERCPKGTCAACATVCPTGALSAEGGLHLDMGRCIFCGACQRACPSGVVSFGTEPALAARSRHDLILRDTVLHLAESLEERALRLFGRSLKLRQVSAGGCGACEADTNVLTTVVFDLGRFGIDFVASPRHADGLYVTGPVPENMREALLKTWEAVPAPKLLIAAGACAISGGPFAGLPEAGTGCEGLLPVDLYIPGCPPHPITALGGLLRLLDRR